MARADRTGNRKSRDSFKKRVPDLGYYFIVTDTNETEENYMYGLRDSLPKELQSLDLTLTLNIIGVIKLC